MKTKVLDISPYKKGLQNRIIHGCPLEMHIIANYSTDKLKQSRLYNEVMVKALDFLVGIESKKDPIQLFEIIKEDDFNTRFMELIDWLEYKLTKEFGPIYKELKVDRVIDTENELKIEVTQI